MTSCNFYTLVAEHRGRSYRPELPLVHLSYSGTRLQAELCDVTLLENDFNIPVYSFGALFCQSLFFGALFNQIDNLQSINSGFDSKKD
jgi:hypothetical protein